MAKTARVTHLALNLLQRADEAGVKRKELINACEQLIEADRRRAAGEEVYVHTEDGALLEDFEDIFVWLEDRRATRLRKWLARQRSGARKLNTERRANHRLRANRLRTAVSALRTRHPDWSDRAIARQLLDPADRADEKKIRAKAAQITRIPK